MKLLPIKIEEWFKCQNESKIKELFSKNQIKDLEVFFNSKKYLTKEDKDNLSKELKTSPKNIGFWFQYQRKKEKDILQHGLNFDPGHLRSKHVQISSIKKEAIGKLKCFFKRTNKKKSILTFLTVDEVQIITLDTESSNYSEPTETKPKMDILRNVIEETTNVKFILDDPRNKGSYEIPIPKNVKRITLGDLKKHQPFRLPKLKYNYFVKSKGDEDDKNGILWKQIIQDSVRVSSFDGKIVVKCCFFI